MSTPVNSKWLHHWQLSYTEYTATKHLGRRKLTRFINFICDTEMNHKIKFE